MQHAGRFVVHGSHSHFTVDQRAWNDLDFIAHMTMNPDEVSDLIYALRRELHAHNQDLVRQGRPPLMVP